MTAARIRPCPCPDVPNEFRLLPDALRFPRSPRRSRVQDLAGLLRCAGDALADEVEEAGDVLKAGGHRDHGADNPAPYRAISTSWTLDRALAITAWCPRPSSTR